MAEGRETRTTPTAGDDDPTQLGSRAGAGRGVPPAGAYTPIDGPAASPPSEPAMADEPRGLFSGDGPVPAPPVVPPLARAETLD